MPPLFMQPASATHVASHLAIDDARLADERDRLAVRQGLVGDDGLVVGVGVELQASGHVFPCIPALVQERGFGDSDALRHRDRG